jgi:DNA-binding PadR family transcriptional regulator
VSPVFRHGRLRLYLLKLLDESPRHGYEVIRLLQDRFMGVYAPSPGTIYPRLARLEEEGLVTHDEADGRKVYRITDKGREELRNRSDDLSELEDEITASVRDIAREVTEDVRETVRNLREELTFAARDMQRRGTAPPHGTAPPRGSGPPRGGPRSSSAWGEALHEEAPPGAGQPGAGQPGAGQPGAGQPGTAHAGDAQAGPEGGEAGRGRDARREREDARRERDRARRERQEARERARHQGAGERSPRADWMGWRGWPPEGSGWTDPATYRDLEQLARRFSGELRAAAAQAHAVSEDAVDDLRTILDDALDRIKAEVFGSQEAPRPGTGRPGAPRGEDGHPGDPGSADDGSEHGTPGGEHGGTGTPGGPR